MINLKKLIPIILVPLVSVHAQKIKSMEFNSQKITDILFALGEESGKSIIPDQSVDGTASFYFAEADCQQVLDNFFTANKLYQEEKGGILYVSRIFCKVKDSLVTLKCSSVPVKILIQSLSEKSGITIICDDLGDEKISLDIKDISLEKALEIATARLNNVSILKKDGWYYVKKDSPSPSSSYKKYTIDENDGKYKIQIESAGIQDLLKLLFERGKKEYSSLTQINDKVENLYFDNKSFEESLTLILEKAGLDYTIKNNIYYIIELSRKNQQSKYKDIQIVQPEFISPRELLALLPSELNSPQNIKSDSKGEYLILSGTNEENKALLDFIKTIDRREYSTEHKKIRLKYADGKNVMSLLPQESMAPMCHLIEDENSILISACPESMTEIEKFIGLLDEKKSCQSVTLRYLKSEDLMKKLPPSIKKESITDSLFPNLIFYTGDPQSFETFRRELELIDKPLPQLKYKLLVVQYTDGNSRSAGAGLTFSKSKSGENYTYAGDLSGIMNLSFNVISAFGFEAAASLNEKISCNRASVFTDTVLTALSGEEVRFQNTDTYRYMEYEYGNTGNTTTTSGITQQITSGLIVNLKGWTSGDDMITMNINATVSKQNSDSSTPSSIPSTSERVVNTQVRTPAGKPVVISGLIKEDESIQESKVPVLGYIPLIRRFFTQKNKTKEKTEIVIYIVPHLIEDEEKVIPDAREIISLFFKEC